MVSQNHATGFKCPLSEPRMSKSGPCSSEAKDCLQLLALIHRPAVHEPSLKLFENGDCFQKPSNIIDGNARVISREVVCLANLIRCQIMHFILNTHVTFNCYCSCYLTWPVVSEIFGYSTCNMEGISSLALHRTVPFDLMPTGTPSLLRATTYKRLDVSNCEKRPLWSDVSPYLCTERKGLRIYSRSRKWEWVEHLTSRGAILIIAVCLGEV